MLWWTLAAHAASNLQPARTVYHELLAPPIGETAFINYEEYPRLSGDASNIIYRAVNANVISVHVMNFDGSNNRVVDVITNDFCKYRACVLNRDGSQQANADGSSLRTGSTSASLGVEALALYTGSINSPALSDDGSKVYFCAWVDGQVATTLAPIARGLYEANANGSGRHIIASHSATAAAIGGPLENVGVFYFAAASADAQRLVFTVTLGSFFTNAILGVNRDGSGLHVIRYVGAALRDVTLSRDGNTVAWDEYVAGGGGLVRAADFAGGNVRVVIPTADASAIPLSLNENGSQLLESSGRIYRTDGLGLRTVLYSAYGVVSDPVLTAGTTAMLAPSGQRGIFIGGRRPYGNQVCTFEFDPAGLGGAPDILSHTVTPDYARLASANLVTATAHVLHSVTNRGVGTVSFRDGRLDNTFYLSMPLLDNGTTGDPVAGDSYYVNNNLQSYYNDPATLGPRTLRFQAESTDLNGLRHATTVDHGTFFVVSNAPSGSSGLSISPGPTTTTNNGRREIHFYGAGFGPERTNNVVTLNGYALTILSASPSELVAELPAWFADGVYAARAWNNGEVSELAKYRSPGLPAPAIYPLSTPILNPLTLAWTAQLRAKYSVFGSTNLVSWISLTNGVPGVGTNLSATVDVSALGGKARFLRVLEENGVLE